MKQTEISRATIGRLPIYLEYLKNAGHLSENISATTLARNLGLGEVQVRKDLNMVSGAGRPKIGYKVSELTAAIDKFLSKDENSSVVIVGAGKLGRALLGYSGFADYGLDIKAAFDIAAGETGNIKSKKPIYPMECFESFCKENNVKIGIITVPPKEAQKVCDLFVKVGIKAIWCFAPCTLSVPSDVTVQYENMALSLAYLNKSISTASKKRNLE